jgi:hypothetical protein
MMAAQIPVGNADAEAESEQGRRDQET